MKTLILGGFEGFLMPKKSKPDNSLPPELSITKELENKVDEMLKSTFRETPNFWEDDISKCIYVPVDDGEIRVLHVKPKNPISKRPVVLLPGWGGIAEAYADLYEVIHDLVEFYYIETREKKSSRLNRKKAKMNMTQKTKDIGEAIKYLGIENDDFVLFGTCWGGAVVLQGLLDKSIDAPTIVTHDPMHTLWFPKWFLRYIAPLLPVFVAEMIKPILRRVQLKGMKEKVQRQRAEAFIDNAEGWKWKKAAQAVKDFELLGNLSPIEHEVFVVNGTQDKVHDQISYPAMAKEMPNGRFVYMKTDESLRERLMGITIREFSKVNSEDGLPSSLSDFEKELKRDIV